MNLYKFFDKFGILVFLFILIDAIFEIKSGRNDFRVILRLLIGIGGLLIDGYLVFFHKEDK